MQCPPGMIDFLVKMHAICRFSFNKLMQLLLFDHSYDIYRSLMEFDFWSRYPTIFDQMYLLCLHSK